MRVQLKQDCSRAVVCRCCSCTFYAVRTLADTCVDKYSGPGDMDDIPALFKDSVQGGECVQMGHRGTIAAGPQMMWHGHCKPLM